MEENTIVKRPIEVTEHPLNGAFVLLLGLVRWRDNRDRAKRISSLVLMAR